MVTTNAISASSDAEVFTGPLDAVLWLARLTKEGIFTGCRRCGEGTVWGFVDGVVKVGMHPTCVPAAMASGVLPGTSPKSMPEPRREVPAPAVDPAVEALVWQQLARWYDK